MLHRRAFPGTLCSLSGTLRESAVTKDHVRRIPYGRIRQCSPTDQYSDEPTCQSGVEPHTHRMATSDDSVDGTRRSLLRVGGGIAMALVAQGTEATVGATLPPAAQQLSDGQPPSAQSANTADILIDTLIHWQVAVVFGVVGDGINLDNRIPEENARTRFDSLPCDYEEAAAFMASGYANAHRETGCVPGDHRTGSRSSDEWPL